MKHLLHADDAEIIECVISASEDRISGIRVSNEK